MQKTRIGKHTTYTPEKTEVIQGTERRELKKKKKLVSVLRDTKKYLECNITNKAATKKKQERDLEVKYMNLEIKIPIGGLGNRRYMTED